MEMEEDNLFGEIDDFLNTTTNAYGSTVSNDNNTGQTLSTTSHPIAQVSNFQILPISVAEVDANIL